MSQSHALESFTWTSDEWPPAGSGSSSSSSSSGGGGSGAVVRGKIVANKDAVIRSRNAMSGYMKQAMSSECALKVCALSLAVSTFNGVAAGARDALMEYAAPFAANVQNNALFPAGQVVVFGKDGLESELQAKPGSTSEPLSVGTEVEVHLAPGSLLVSSCAVTKAGPLKEYKKREAVDVSGIFNTKYNFDDVELPDCAKPSNDDEDEWSE